MTISGYSIKADIIDNMKTMMSSVGVLIVILVLSLSVDQKASSQPSRPNTFAPVPIQVMGDCRMTNFALGTGLIGESFANISNNFTGWIQTNITFGWVTNSSGATGAPIVGALTTLEKGVGFYEPGVTQPQSITDPNAMNWLSRGTHGSNDIGLVGTFKVQPMVLVFGATISFSNWNGGTFRGWDIIRIGQSPYAIMQLNDNSSDHPKTGIALWVHTPDAPQTGSPVTIVDNGEVYMVMLLYDGHNDYGAVRVAQKLTNGRLLHKGESKLPMAGAGTAANVWFSLHDDHSGLFVDAAGDIRVSHYWFSTNREIFLNSQFPAY